MSTLVDKAIVKAVLLHQGQTRKGDGTPFIAHPLAVALLLAPYTQDDEVLAAALLHDTLEDTPYTALELDRDFGTRIREMVQSVTIYNSQGDWEERKRIYLDRIASFSEGSRLICCGDKIHNLSTLAAALEENGEIVWRKFGAPPQRLIWFHQEAYARLSQDWSHPLLEGFAKALKRLVSLAPPGGWKIEPNKSTPPAP